MIKILSFLAIFFPHEFYVSVSYMEFDPKRKAIEVQKKIFFDDLELAIKKKNQTSDNVRDYAIADVLILSPEDGSINRPDEIVISASLFNAPNVDQKDFQIFKNLRI